VACCEQQFRVKGKKKKNNGWGMQGAAGTDTRLRAFPFGESAAFFAKGGTL